MNPNAPNNQPAAATRFDADACADHLALLLPEPGDVVEVRILDGRRGARAAGYFDDIDAAVEAIKPWALHHDVDAIYVTLNQIDPRLIRRYSNRMEPKLPGMRNAPQNTTTDKDVLRRRWLLIDCDVERPAGVPASEDERAACRQLARNARDFLIAPISEGGMGWPADSIAAMSSGNGYYLLARVDLPNDDASRDLCKRCLEALGAKFDTPEAHIDKMTFNASRIAALCGTRKGKGDDTPEAPHRLVTPMGFPASPVAVPLESLQALAALAPAPVVPPRPAFGAPLPPFDMEAFLSRHAGAIEVLDGPQASGGWTRWYVRCPWNPDHAGKDAYLSVSDAGAPAYHCSHNSCAGNDFRALRSMLGDSPEPTRTPAPRPTPKFAPIEGTVSSAPAHAPSNAPSSPPAPKPSEARQARAAAVAAVVASGLPVIETNGVDPVVVREAATGALIASNGPGREHLFWRGSQLVRVAVDSFGSPLVEAMTTDLLSRELENTARFVSTSDRRGQVFVEPPAGRVRAILAGDTFEGFPRLTGLAASPVLLPGGRILARRGFDAGSGVYLSADAPPEVSAALAGHAPDQSEAREALRRLLTGPALGDFCFAGPADVASALALVLTMFCRPFIAGPAPMFVIEAPVQGSGKTLLAQSLALVGAGTAPMHNAPTARGAAEAEAEWQKLLGASLSSAPPVLIFDNVKGELSSTTLEGCLTADSPYRMRILGTSTEAVVDPRATTYIVTANNITTSPDIARRSVVIRLNPQVENPSLRTGFQADDLMGYVRAHRGELLADVCRIVAAWVGAGCPESPEGKYRKGSFPRWARVIGGLLDFLDVPGFLDGDVERARSMDAGSEALGAFVDGWASAFGSRLVSVRDLLGVAQECEYAGGQMSPQGFSHRLKAMRDRVIDGWRVTSSFNSDSKSHRWALLRTDRLPIPDPETVKPAVSVPAPVVPTAPVAAPTQTAPVEPAPPVDPPVETIPPIPAELRERMEIFKRGVALGEISRETSVEYNGYIARYLTAKKDGDAPFARLQLGKAEDIVRRAIAEARRRKQRPQVREIPAPPNAIQLAGGDAGSGGDDDLDDPFAESEATTISDGTRRVTII